MSNPSAAELSPGAEIEVRTHYQASWARGFEVASVSGDRVAVRRRSDGSLLPVAVDRADVRRPLRTSNDSPWMTELHAIASMRRPASGSNSATSGKSNGTSQLVQSP